MLHTGSKYRHPTFVGVVSLQEILSEGFWNSSCRNLRVWKSMPKSFRRWKKMKKGGKDGKPFDRALRLRLNSRPIIVLPMWNFWQRQGIGTDRAVFGGIFCWRQNHFCRNDSSFEYVYNISKIIWYMICMYVLIYLYIFMIRLLCYYIHFWDDPFVHIGGISFFLALIQQLIMQIHSDQCNTV